MKFWLFPFSIFIFFSLCKPLSAQNNDLTGKTKLLNLIDENKIEDAQNYLKTQIDYFKTNNLADSLAHYTEFVGSFKLNNQNRARALEKTEAYVSELVKREIPYVSKFAYKELAWIQDEAGRPDLAYSSIEKALEFAKLDNDNKKPTISDLYYNMGYYASAKGDYKLSKENYVITLEKLRNSPDKDYVFLQQVNNALGGIMWREGKMDSCSYYFKNSLQALKNTEPNPLNSFYRPALVYMNMAVVSNIKGDNEEAILFSKQAIQHYNQYIKEENNEQKINAAIGNKLVAIDNLGVFYNSVGQFTKAEDIITYSYQQKQKTKEANDPNLVISKIILAQAKINTQDYLGAKQLLEDAIQNISENPGVQPYWKASALSTQAKVYDKLHQIDSAAVIYEKARVAFIESVNGNYNNDILSEISAMAVFYAENGFEEKALERAEEVLDQTLKSDFKDTPQGYSFMLSVADVYYHLKDYEKTLELSTKIITSTENLSKSSAPIDRILKRFHLPYALLLKSKAKLELHTDPDVELLIDLTEDLNRAFEIIALKQSLLENFDDVTLMISQNEELIGFVKKIQMLLFQKTGDDKYLNTLIQLNESAIYNRIRTRLQIKKSISTNKLPDSILQIEKKLKNTLNTALKDNSDEGITEFFKASNQWEEFQKDLEKQFPDYYKLRYSSLSLDNVPISQYMHSDKTTIRYLFVDEQLYALVLNQNKKKTLIPLESTHIESSVTVMKENPYDAEISGEHSHRLYKDLWEPLEKHIKSKQVVIIPSGSLFNLNFELLSSIPINDFKVYQTHSLLAKYSISYQYSLWMAEQDNIIQAKEDFIAFAPTFDQEMKNNYLASITDSTELDKTYLKLLPQPFTKDLVMKYKKTFKGLAFLNQEAAKPVFLSKANEHKIIHIGTHAETNNFNPELSRLVFAKSIENDSITENNSLFAYEIYNYNLQSELAVLTACETGKPLHQPGEGMISLTHAFTYAGSKSIVTSLWNVDEQSSATIIASFYDYLKQGLSKDKALQKAKLDYLATREGRTIAPQYWAGLVLMGDTSPIEIQPGPNWMWFIILLLAVLIAITIYVNTKHKPKQE